MSRQSRLLFIISSLVAMVLFSQSPTQSSISAQTSDENPLFIPLDSAPTFDTDMIAPQENARFMRLSSAFDATQDRLALNVLPDELWIAQRDADALAHDSPDSVTWVGRIDGQPLSRVILTYADDGITGYVTTEAASYRIYEVEDGVHVVGVDTTHPDDADGLTGKLAEAANAITKREETFPLLQNPVADIVVLFTPTAASQRANIWRDVDQEIAVTNQAFADSGITSRLRLVHKGSISTIGNDANYDRQQFLEAVVDPADGVLDDAYAIRAQYGADLVAFLASVSDRGGRAYSGYTSVRRRSDFFSVTNTRSIGGTTFPHEIGHNFRMEHNIEDANDTRSTAYRPWAYAYRKPGAFRTIMSYACLEDGLAACPRIFYFSNLDALYQGQPMGVADEADAQRTVNEFGTTMMLTRTCRPGGLYKMQSNNPNALMRTLALADGESCANTSTVQLLPNTTYTIDTPVLADPFTGYSALPMITGDVTIDGNGSTIVLNGSDFRLAYVFEDAHLTLKNVTVTGGNGERGGMIYNRGRLSVINSTLQNATATEFGGIIYSVGQQVYILDSTLQNSTSTDFGGAVFTFDDTGTQTMTVQRSRFINNDSQAGGGGAIMAQVPTYINESTFSQNVARDGGAVYTFESDLAIENSLFTENTADATRDTEGTAYGGAIYTYDSELVVVNTTLSANTAEATGGLFAQLGNVSIAFSTFFNNTDTDTYAPQLWTFDVPYTAIRANIFQGNGERNCRDVTSQNVNISDDGTCGGSSRDLTNTNPLVFPLDDNGGEVQTHRLRGTSPAIDHVASGSCVYDDDANANTSMVMLTRDARGAVRPLASSCDSGAVEGNRAFDYDLNNDGIISPVDAIIVINDLGTTTMLSDINQDGAVNGLDVDLIEERYGTTP